MKMFRAKTKRRLLILSVMALALAVGVGSLTFYQKHRQRKWLLQNREEGLAAARRGDDPNALTKLGRYLQKNPNDVEALGMAAVVRQRLPDPQNSHIFGAIDLWRRVQTLDPQNRQAREALLELYHAVERNTEALTTAESILAVEADNTRALHIKSLALARLRQFDAALATAERWAAVAPEDIEAHATVLLMLSQLPQGRERVVRQARQLAEAHPADARYKLLLGLAYVLGADRDRASQLVEARRLLREAAQAKLSDPYTVRLLVVQFDFLGLFEDSLRVLEQAAGPDAPPQIHRALIRRLWEAGLYARLLEKAATLPAPVDQEADTLAFRGASMILSGRKDQALPLIAQLQARQEDPVSLGWAAILRHLAHPPDVDLPTIIQKAQSAVARDPHNAYIRYYLGEAFAQLGEVDLALNTWQQVANQNRSWALPLVRSARVLLDAGRGAAALKLAQGASFRAPTDPSVAVTLLQAMAAGSAASAQDSSRPRDVLRAVEEIQARMPAEENTLPIYVEMLCRTSQRETAIRVINEALALPAEPQDDRRPRLPGEGSLLRLAAVARQFNLGLDDKCMQTAQRAYGLTPGIALAQAALLAEQGKAEEGLRLLEQASGGSASLQWRMARATFLDQVGHPQAVEAWKSLAGDAGLNAQVLQMVLQARQPWSDRPFIKQTVERLRHLTTDAGLGWRLAQARWLLEGPATSENLTEAQRLLREAIGQSPNLPEAQVLLARCLMKMNLPAEAIAAYRAALALTSAAAIRLELVQALQERKDFAAARQELDRLAQNPELTPQQRREAALLLLRQGEPQAAVDILQGVPADTPGAQQNDLLQAALLRRLHRDAEAETLIRRLLQKPDAIAVQFAADFYASQQRFAEAEAALAHLSRLPLEPAVEQIIRANHHLRHGPPEKATEFAESAAAAAPRNAVAWHLLVQSHLARGQVGQAIAAAERGLKEIPGDKALTVFRQGAEMAGRAYEDLTLRPLLFSVLRAPDDAQIAMDAIAAVVQGELLPDGGVGDLLRLAEKHPAHQGLQALLVQRLAMAGRLAEAIERAKANVVAFAHWPEAAQVATGLLARAGRWDEALQMAQEWRRRAPSQTMLADLAIAEIEINNRRLAAAEKVLQPYLANADGQQPNPMLVNLRARILIGQGDSDGALAVFQPLLSGGSHWRSMCMAIAVQNLKNAGSAGKWLKAVAAAIPPEAAEEKVMLAEQWLAVHRKHQDASARQEALAVLGALTDGPAPVARALEVRAIMAGEEGRLADAEADYRRALQMQPNLHLSQNNLAMLLADRQEDRAEALRLARAAVAARPDVAAFRDTLAQVLVRSGDAEQALISLRAAANLEPDNLQWKVATAEVLLRMGRRSEAAQIVADIEARSPSAGGLSSAVRRRLDELKKALSLASTTP